MPVNPASEALHELAVLTLAAANLPVGFGSRFLYFAPRNSVNKRACKPVTMA